MAVEKGRVKWSSPKKPFCYLVLGDGRDVFLHQDDFEGHWPPTYYQTVKFELLRVSHKTCQLRAKHAVALGEASAK